MTISYLPRTTRMDAASHTESPARCELCGSLVIDPAAHAAICVDHELDLFAIGRRAG